MHISLSQFPVVIEPTVSLLELQAVAGHGEPREIKEGEPGTYQVFRRFPLGRELWGVVPDQARHIFGDAETFDDCTVLVCYNTGGVLIALIMTVDGESHTIDVPAELVGRVVEKPSVRLVFETTSARDRFLATLDEDTLGELAEPPRAVGVSVTV